MAWLGTVDHQDLAYLLDLRTQPPHPFCVFFVHYSLQLLQIKSTISYLVPLLTVTGTIGGL
jgi:hypothetical protein